MDNELSHAGRKGMKWGQHIFCGPNCSEHGKKGNRGSADGDGAEKSTSSSGQKKTVKDLSDDELRAKINRLELEKRLADLSKAEATTSKGKEFIMDVLEKSGKNITTQLATYAMGTAVNKILKDVFNDDAVVNPKKGQKDK